MYPAETIVVGVAAVGDALDCHEQSCCHTGPCTDAAKSVFIEGNDARCLKHEVAWNVRANAEDLIKLGQLDLHFNQPHEQPHVMPAFLLSPVSRQALF